MTDYRAHPSISQSGLKKYCSFPIIEKKFNKEGTIVGSVVDCLAFTPEDFERDYIVMTIDKPTDKMLDLCNLYMQLAEGIPEQQLRASIVFDEAFKLSDFTSSYKNTAKKRFEEVGRPYIDKVTEAKGKTLVSPSQKAKADERLLALQSSEQYQKYTKNAKFQVEVYGELEGVECKGLLDIMQVTDDTVYITDLKETEYALTWYDTVFYKLKYYIQDAMYYSLIKKEYPDKNVIFTFMVQDNYNILFYEVNMKSMIKHIKGAPEIVSPGMFMHKNKEYPSLNLLLERYKYHQKTGIILPEELINNNFKIMI